MSYYKLPDNPCTINFSGGRSSAYMLHKIVEAYGGTLPDNLSVVFCNTGREHAKTYEFVQRVQDDLAVQINWLEYRFYPDRKGGVKDPRHDYEQVTYESASREGEPFDMLIQSKQRLPNVFRRFCTQELKVKTIYRYMRRERNIKEWHSIIGLRYDEGRRVFRLLAQPCSVRPEKLPSIMPMFDAGVTERNVHRFWDGMPYRLELPKALGNCDLCFLKGKGLKVEAIRQEPGMVKWWLEHEERNRQRWTDIRDKTKTQFDESNRVRDLVALAGEKQLFDDTDDAEAGDVACHCTD